MCDIISKVSSKNKSKVKFTVTVRQHSIGLPELKPNLQIEFKNWILRFKKKRKKTLQKHPDKLQFIFHIVFHIISLLQKISVKSFQALENTKKKFFSNVISNGISNVIARKQGDLVVQH